MSHSRPPFALFLIVILAVLGGMHVYLWMRLVRDPGLAGWWRRGATALLALLALTPPLGMAGLRRFPDPFSWLLPAVGFTWLGVAFLLFCAVLALDVARVLGRGGARLADRVRATPDPPPDPERRRFVAQALAGTAVLATGGAAAFAFRSATGPAEVTEVAVRLARLPRALSGLTIAQITDLHVGPTIGEREVRRVVEQVNALRPDVVAVTGDLVDGPVRRLGQAVAHLGRLRARYGVYFVTGNHEYISGAAEWREELRRLGLRVLRNERVAVGDRGASFDLAGVDDWSAGRFVAGEGPDLARALRDRDPDRSLVLLAHQPRGMEEAVRSGVELQISGHTHGGQIAPFSLLVRAVYPYVYGLYPHREGARSGSIFVSRGTGYWGPPLRLGAPPEIARLVLTP